MYHICFLLHWTRPVRHDKRHYKHIRCIIIDNFVHTGCVWCRHGVSLPTYSAMPSRLFTEGWWKAFFLGTTNSLPACITTVPFQSKAPTAPSITPAWERHPSIQTIFSHVDDCTHGHEVKIRRNSWESTFHIYSTFTVSVFI